MTRRPVAAFLTFLAPTAPLAAQTLDSAQVHRVDSVFAAYASTDSPGYALAITQHGTIVYQRGYGMASLEQQVPITPRTVFDLGEGPQGWSSTS